MNDSFQMSPDVTKPYEPLARKALIYKYFLKLLLLFTMVQKPINSLRFINQQVGLVYYY
jgi:hypothetical protein